MSQKADGMNYAPQGKPKPVVKPGEFKFAAMNLDHGHIYGQCNGLIEAGAELAAVYDPDPAKVEAFVKKFPQAEPAAKAEAILEDKDIKLVAAAAIPNERGPLGCRVMKHGKDYFTDKTPFTTLAQLAEAKKVVAETKRKYMVYFSERLHVESAVYAGELVKQGAIGRVVQVIGLGPHRLTAPSRPAWFFNKEQYGGILTDIGSHQLEQFLFFTGNENAKILAAKVSNYNSPAYPELEDFGDVTLVGDNGATGYHRVDWLTPDGLCSWGDGRLFLLGTEGFIELRKYLNLAASKTGDHVFWADKKGEHHEEVAGKVGYPFFGELILDCINRTEKAMTQEHAFKAAELCMQAQAAAVRV
ncbi:MAG: Gfo/Idh/MocA family oxidoreductase [Spirochaetes bacterium]|nr:Gfo/Idh/MocA family oxidoreductase [Spirochaetota bacterium]